MLRVILASTALLVLAVSSPASAADWTDDARIDRWFADLERNARTSAALPALVHLDAHQEYTDVAPRLDVAAERLLSRPSTDPVVAARLHEWLGTRSTRRGDADAARLHFLAAGHLPDWATLGPYPNYGGASMGRVVGPEVPDCAEGCEHEGRDMAWIERPGFGAHGMINLGACMEERSDTIAFARTFVHVHEDTPAALYVGGARPPPPPPPPGRGPPTTASSSSSAVAWCCGNSSGAPPNPTSRPWGWSCPRAGASCGSRAATSGGPGASTCASPSPTGDR